MPRSLRTAWVVTRAEEGSIENAVVPTLMGARKLAILMAVVVPVFAGIAAPLVPILYGHAFTPTIKPFLILLGATFILSTAFPFITGLTGGGRPGKTAVVSWTSLAVTIGVDAVLVPRHGALGAAVGSLASYFAFAVVAFSGVEAGGPPRNCRSQRSHSAAA